MGLFEIGDVVRKLRITKAKMDLVAFAKRAGVNKATLSKIENCGNCSTETLKKIAAAFGLTVSELYAYLNTGPVVHTPAKPHHGPFSADERLAQNVDVKKRKS